MNTEEKIAKFEKKYGMSFEEFDNKVREEGFSSPEEEDDWIDWGDLIEVRNYFLDDLDGLDNRRIRGNGYLQGLKRVG